MTQDSIILFLFSLLGGFAAFFTTVRQGQNYRLALVFSGAYLFAITIVHILPELFTAADRPTYIGIFVLLGFFLQQWLENYSQGVEHGHLHEHHGEHIRHSGIILLVALSIHAFLEGALLSHPSEVHPIHSSGPLLWGIVLHKIPAAYALMTVVRCEDKSLGKSLVFLGIFAAASPLGIFTADYVMGSGMLSYSAIGLLFALVSGGFLHISTTIVFESNENHRLNLKKWSVAVVGAGLAVLAELL